MKCSILILRIVLAIILFAHSLPGMFNGGVNNFGEFFLNQIGFSPYGVLLAWAIKLSHVFCAVLLLLNRCIMIACSITIFVLIAGIVLVHFKEGWFVVGGGTNGVEYNFLLICTLVAVMLPNHNDLLMKK